MCSLQRPDLSCCDTALVGSSWVQTASLWARLTHPQLRNPSSSQLTPSVPKFLPSQVLHPATTCCFLPLTIALHYSLDMKNTPLQNLSLNQCPENSSWLLPQCLPDAQSQSPGFQRGPLTRRFLKAGGYASHSSALPPLSHSEGLRK